MKKIKRKPATRPEDRPEHPRVSETGRRLGAVMHQFYIAGERILERQNERPADCCASCAFLRGSVPNGCLQTQMDVLKSVIELKPFLCHVVPPGALRPVCRGWYAAVQFRKTLKCPLPATDWNFSPPDEEP